MPKILFLMIFLLFSIQNLYSFSRLDPYIGPMMSR